MSTILFFSVTFTFQTFQQGTAIDLGFYIGKIGLVVFFFFFAHQDPFQGHFKVIRS